MNKAIVYMLDGVSWSWYKERIALDQLGEFILILIPAYQRL